MVLNYYGIWRDIIVYSRDIADILDSLNEKNFPFAHGLSVNPSDFRYVSVDKRKIRVVNSIANLPSYIFEKNLQRSTSYVDMKKKQSFFGRLFQPQTPTNIIKFSKNDSNLLLGANTLEDLTDLVIRCGFQTQDLNKLFERDDFTFRYQAIYNDHVIYKNDCVDLFISLSELGAFVGEFHKEKPSIKSIPPEKQTVIINEKKTKLYPNIFQVRIVPDSPIIYGLQKPYWLVLGASCIEELKVLVDYMGISFDEGIAASNVMPAYPRRTIPKEIQLFVWRRDNGRCVDCGSNENLEFDHIIPISKGGSNTARNIQLLCENCNRKKSNNIG